MLLSPSGLRHWPLKSGIVGSNPSRSTLQSGKLLVAGQEELPASLSVIEAWSALTSVRQAVKSPAFQAGNHRFEPDTDDSGIVEWNHTRLIIWRCCSSQLPPPVRLFRRLVSDHHWPLA